MLYRMTLVDTLLSALCVCAFYDIVPRLPLAQAYAAELDVVLPSFNWLYEGSVLVGASFVFALIAVSIVARKIGRV